MTRTDTDQRTDKASERPPIEIAILALRQATASPIYGMPVLQVWKARTVFFVKRSLGSGYAGVENPLFFKENTRMLFGDAQESLEGVLKSLDS